MDTMAAFMMGMLNRNNTPKVFDWNKAAEIIKERNVRVASAGLQGDLEYTEGVILEDGIPVMDDYTYLASTWATPVLIIYHNDLAEYEEIPCFIYGDKTEWDADTKWPQSALDILSREKHSA